MTRISSETGVPVSTLQAQKSATGLGNGDLEAANLLAKASGQTFDKHHSEVQSRGGLW